MSAFTQLRKNIKKDFSGFKSIKVAILSDAASQLLHQAIKGYGYEKQIHYQIFEADYNQIELEIYTNDSALYAFQPDVIIIAKHTQKLLKYFYQTSHAVRNQFAEQQATTISELVNKLEENTSAKIIVFNFQEIDDAVFGNYANKLQQSFLYQVRKLNLLLMEQAQSNKTLHICDVQQATLQYGLMNVIDSKNYILADQTWSLDFLSIMAGRLSSMIEAFFGSIKKCLVLDLDNTLWGGVIGDDGIEGIQLGTLGIGKAFTQLQYWCKELQRRGIILCVCSKNTEAIAMEAFNSHPDMILKPSDIAVFAINWNNKVDNLNFIQQTINISFDAMVFLDDSAFERAMVKEAIPALTMPDLPEDPADYLYFLQQLNLFETTSFTDEDEHRTQQYKQAAERTVLQKKFTNEEEFLKSLQMEAEISPLNAFTIPRAAQLSQRSNQFNLTTIRYSEQDLKRIAENEHYVAFTVRLQDHFGDNGIISLLVLKINEQAELAIETWLMSCRVLKRGVENAVLNYIMEIAISLQCTSVVGRYLPTAKNEIVKDHYANLGFKQKNDWWQLDVSSYKVNNTAIKLIKSSIEVA